MIFDILSREEIILFIFDNSRLFVVALFSSESPTQDIVTSSSILLLSILYKSLVKHGTGAGVIVLCF